MSARQELEALLLDHLKAVLKEGEVDARSGARVAGLVSAATLNVIRQIIKDAPEEATTGELKGALADYVNRRVPFPKAN